MNKKSFCILLFIFLSVATFAANTVTSVEKVTEAVTVGENVDYHITGTEPFGDAGSVNFVDKRHAVVIFDNLRPSVVKQKMANIKVDGVNATLSSVQLRIYGHGTIVYPYAASMAPLTVYDKDNYEGDSYSNYTVGEIVTLSSATMNNNIRSFKLKRGYMVCMATLASGGGYNRIFVADEADKEVPVLQSELYGKVSFIRISKWNNTDKRGYAGNDVTANSLLNTTWCYNWDAGSNVWDDREYVTQHHHEGWPGITDVGNNGTSANILGNNEPDNTADSREHYNTVDEVLANWPAMMATGKRLGSPAVSGNYNWLYQFIDSIDARGWRCDFIAVHAYWYSDKSSWEWQMNNIHSQTGRPIWITEMNYGANWTGWPGTTREGNTDNYAIEKQHFAPTLDYLNATPFVERYAVYNWVEDCRKMYNTGDATLKDKNYLTPMGEYYANAATSLSYQSAYEYIPKGPRLSAPNSFACTFNPKNSTCTLTWKDNNGEFNDSIIVERRLGANGAWTILSRMSVPEAASTMTYADVVTASGTYYYRIREVTYNGKVYLSPEIMNVINGTEGTENIQYGTVSSASTDETYNFFSYPFDDMPAIVFGSPTSKNIDVKPVEHLVNSYKLNDKYSYFRFSYFPWSLSGYQTLTKGAEFSTYIVAKKGNGKIGDLNYEAGYIHDAQGNEFSVSRDTVDFVFDKPFFDTPVVFVTPRYTTSTYPYMWRVWKVTNTGFKVVLLRQKGLDDTYPGFVSQRVAYFAIDKGDAILNGKKFKVGSTNVTFSNQASLYKVQYGETLTNPKFMGQLQSFRRKVAGLLRTGSNGSSASFCNVRLIPDSSDVDNRTMTISNPISEDVGWLVISDDPAYDGIDNLCVSSQSHDVDVLSDGNVLSVTDAEARMVSLYRMNGIKMVSTAMLNGNARINVSGWSDGLYLIRTDAGHSCKFVKGK